MSDEHFQWEYEKLTDALRAELKAAQERDVVRQTAIANLHSVIVDKDADIVRLQKQLHQTETERNMASNCVKADGEEIARLRKALNPADRLKAGDCVHAGYVPSNVADLVHCLNIAMWQMQQKSSAEDVPRIKQEIERVINQCDEAFNPQPAQPEKA